MAADLASDLRFFLAVVVVEIVMRGIADRTDNQFWNCVGVAPAPDRTKWLPVKGLILN